MDDLSVTNQVVSPSPVREVQFRRSGNGEQQPGKQSEHKQEPTEEDAIASKEDVPHTLDEQA
jgi:hypothetical protein